MTEFTGILSDGDSIELGNGLTATVTFPLEESAREPWLEEDGHGFIKQRRGLNYAGYIAKAPGERVMWKDGSWAYVYDIRRTMQKAIDEGWGSRNATPAMTKRQIAALAVEEDFQRMAGYLNDNWWYVMTRVSITDEMGDELATECLGFCESDAGEYLTETVNICLSHAMEQIGPAIDSALADCAAKSAMLSNLKTAIEAR